MIQLNISFVLIKDHFNAKYKKSFLQINFCSKIEFFLNHCQAAQTKLSQFYSLHSSRLSCILSTEKMRFKFIYLLHAIPQKAFAYLVYVGLDVGSDQVHRQTQPAAMNMFCTKLGKYNKATCSPAQFMTIFRRKIKVF